MISVEELGIIAEMHLASCFDAVEAKEEGREVYSPAIAPFDGCVTCIVREMLVIFLDYSKHLP